MKMFLPVFGLLLSCVLLPIKSVGQPVKIGYADQNYIFNNMPEYQYLGKEIEVNATKYQNILKEKYALFQQKIEVYQKAKESEAANAVLKDKEKELQDLQKSIEDFEVNSESDLKTMHQKKFAPIQEKVINAIIQFGRENNFTYIIRLHHEEGAGEIWPILLYSSDSTGDVSNKILLRLGVSDPVRTNQETVGLAEILKKK